MIQALKIKNREVITRLDLMARTVYKQPASYNQAPKPNITLAKLRTAMAANDGKMELTNNIDYVGREAPDGSVDLGRLRNIFKEIICTKTGSANWYWDTYMAQVPYWGWTGWNNNKGKGKLFLRFIHNSGRGETRYVSKGRYKKIPDQHSVYNAGGCYETPGGTIMLKAHRALESITLDREVAHFKDSLIAKYADLVYNGYWWSPERLMMQAAINESQAVVNGEVRLKLYKGSVAVTGRRSDQSLFDEAIATFEDDAGAYDQKDAEGFIKLNALRLRTAAKKGRSLR